MWLAERLGVALPQQPAEAQSEMSSDRTGPEDTPPVSGDPTSQADPSTKVEEQTPEFQHAGDEKGEPPTPFDLYRPSSHEAGVPRAIGFRPPGLPALAHSLEIGRALDPLRRRMPSRRDFEVDEEETVRRLAEEKLWLPAFTPRRERWSELALVVDAGRSLRMWRPTLAELRRLLERHGAFRDLRGWRLDFADSPPRLVSDARASLRQEARGVGELQDPSGRRIILVASDCVGPWWRDGRMHAVLRSWASRGPVALVQLLPQRLWPRTPLGLAGLRLAADAPGLSNAQLRVLWPPNDRDRSPPLPVMTLDPFDIRRWASVLAGLGGASVPGVRLSRFKPTAPTKRRAPEPALALDARERVRRFGASASGPARELAVYLTAVPLTLPVMRLVQQLMLPSSRHVHLAEFLLGGLVRPVTKDADEDPDDVEYEFYDPAIRDLLRDGQTAAEAMEVTARVIDALSAFVAGEQGSPRSFGAALVDDSGRGPLTLPPGGRPFARLGAEALRRYGGAYAELADRLAGGWEVAPELELTLERKLTLDRGPIREIAWSPDGERLAVADDKVSGIWTTAGAIERRVDGTHIAWRPAGTSVAIGGPGPYIVLHRLSSWEPVDRSSIEDPPVTTIAWSSDERSLAIGTHHGALSFWEPENGTRRSAKCRGAIRQLAWSGDWIAVASDEEREALVIDRHELRVVLRLPSEDAPPRSVAWSNDGEFLFCGNESGHIAVWRIERMVSAARPIPPPPAAPQRILAGHSGPVTALTLDVSQQLLASQSEDGTARIWRLDQWRCLAVIPIGAPPEGGGVRIAFHPRRPLLAAPEESGDALRLSRVRLRKSAPHRALEPPHILMPMWEIPPLVVGGVWTACYNLVRRLRRSGVRVTVVVPWPRDRILPDPFGDGTPVAALGIVPPGEAPTTQSSYSHTPPQWSTTSIGPSWSNYATPSVYDFVSVYGMSPHTWSSYGGAPPAWSNYGGYGGFAWSSYGGRPGGPYSSYGEGTSLTASPLFALIGEFRRRFRQYAEERGADLIHAHDWVTFDAARDAAARLGVPWIAHFHSLESDRRPDGGDPLIERIEQGAANNATCIVAPSNVTRRRLQESYNVGLTRLWVVPNSPSDAPPPSSEFGDPTSGRIVFIGRLARQKGVDRFCDVADIVGSVNEKARFEIFGDGDTRGSLRDRAVVWRGPLGWNERGRAFAGASVVIVPSRAEPFGMVIVEAMERRIPVIFPSDSGAAEELAAGIRVDTNDVGGIAKEVMRLLDDSEYWRTTVELQTRALRDYEARAGYETRLVALWTQTIAAPESGQAHPPLSA